MAKKYKKNFEKNQEKMWGQWIYTYTWGGWGVAHRSRWRDSWTLARERTQPAQKVIDSDRLPPHPYPMPQRCAEIGGELVVIWW